MGMLRLCQMYLTVNLSCPTGRIDKEFAPLFILRYLRIKLNSVLCSVSVLLKPVDSFVRVRLWSVTENKAVWSSVLVRGSARKSVGVGQNFISKEPTVTVSTPSPCFTPVYFTPFYFNTPCQFRTPLNFALSNLLFNTSWLTALQDAGSLILMGISYFMYAFLFTPIFFRNVTRA